MNFQTLHHNQTVNSQPRLREAPGGTGTALRVLMTLDAVGGVWRYAMELAAALKPRGIETCFAGLGPAPGKDKRAEAERIGRLAWLDRPLDWTAASEGELSGLGEEILLLANSFGADIVHLNAPAQAAAFPDGLPVVAVSHSCVPTWWKAMRGDQLPDEWQWHACLNAKGFERAEATVVPSAAHGAALRRCYGPLPRLQTVHNGVSGKPRMQDKEDFILAAGRWWDESKNSALLHQVAGRLEWPLRLAGASAGPNGQLVELDTGHWLGEMRHPELIAMMRRAAIVVSPSLYEPFGLVALEAARNGAALALADIATYRELWDGAALFFDPGSAESLQRALNALSRDRALRHRLGLQALERSQRYTPELQAARMVQIYREVMTAGQMQRQGLEA